MKISTRGRYSLRMAVDLAQHYNDGFIALKDVSARQDISKKYLEQIIPFLIRSGILATNRGHMGGYKLAKPPAEITVKDVIVSAEGSLAPVSCMEGEVNDCPRRAQCLTLPIYTGLYKVIDEYLSSITLQDIIDKGTTADDYCI